jgi:hypothetical protein
VTIEGEGWEVWLVHLEPTLECGVKPYQGISNPLIAEALLLRDCVIFADLRGYPDVVMETDCFEIINHWIVRSWHRFYKKLES